MQADSLSSGLIALKELFTSSLVRLYFTRRDVNDVLIMDAQRSCQRTFMYLPIRRRPEQGNQADALLIQELLLSISPPINNHIGVRTLSPTFLFHAEPQDSPCDPPGEGRLSV